MSGSAQNCTSDALWMTMGMLNRSVGVLAKFSNIGKLTLGKSAGPGKCCYTPLHCNFYGALKGGGSNYHKFLGLCPFY